jgi:hypothetical protein
LAEVAESPTGKVAAFWKFVYIAEAHAMDEWPVKSARFNQGRGPVVVEKQPTTMTERCALARKFVSDFSMNLSESSYEVLVDDPEKGDPFEKTYAPWPLRLYLICDSKIEWIAEPRSCSYADAVTELMKILNLT